MSYAIIFILILLLLSGCAAGKFSVYQGTAKFAIPFDFPGAQNKGYNSPLEEVYVGMPEFELRELFKDFRQGTYRQNGNQERITFYLPETQEPESKVIFLLLDGKVKEWKRIK